MILESIRPELHARILRTAPNNLIGYWPMSERSGSIAIDASPKGNNGAYTGVTLGQPGIGDGRTCPLFDGANDYNNIYSAGLRDDFNGAEGTVLVWLKVNGVAVWGDGATRLMLKLYADGSNRILLYKRSDNNQIEYFRNSGGILDRVTQTGVTTTDWFATAMTWSTAADELIAYFNGAQEGAIQTGLGTWAGTLGAALVGAQDTVPTNVFDGYEAYAAVWTTPLSPAQIAAVSVL